MDDSIKTGVDGLLDVLQKKGKLSLQEAAKILGISENIVKLWVDFLVEEKIVGLEYKFTKAYIYLNKEKKEVKSKIIEQKKVDINAFKKEFDVRAKKSSIPQQEVMHLWKEHILNQLELEKPFFFREARKRNLESIEELWDEYKEGLVKT